MTTVADAPLAFSLPDELVAHAPPEARGLARDDIRMLVARRGEGDLHHTHLRDLAAWLRPGDVLAVNTSAVRPSAVDVVGAALRVHLSTVMPDGDWLVELRVPDGAASQPYRGGRGGQVLRLAGGGAALLVEPHPRGSGGAPVRLWRAVLELPGGTDRYLARHGTPIRYGPADLHWDLRHYQTVFAREVGSAESPSAGLGFTPRLLARLVAAGVRIAPLVLHTGVSSGEAHEPPYPEWYRVTAGTAKMVNDAAATGHRIIAVGTTVVRALETVASGGGVSPGQGWTDLVVTPERGVRVVGGLLTGWHEPAASHLRLLEAVAGRELLERSYAEALASGYLWHQFGDVHLILP